MTDSNDARREGGAKAVDEVYERLADQLDALPNGFPRTKSGVEIRLLKKIATPDEAWLAGQLGRSMETAGEIAARTGLSEPELTERLRELLRKGFIHTGSHDGTRRYRLAPFLVGIYEGQLDTLDHELAHLMEQYMMLQGAKGILGPYPAVHRVVPAQQAAKTEWILPYDDVRALFVQANSFIARDCICRKEQDILGERKCDSPRENCLSFSPVEGAFGQDGISRDEALAILDETEQVGLVHTVSNSIADVSYVCNCCGCCCAILRGITEWGVENSVARANYYAETDLDLCVGCGTCEDRCQVGAVSVVDDVAVVDRSRCIGCGLCVTGCPNEAMHLHLRPDAEMVHPPASFEEWEEERLRNRGLAE